MSDVQLSLMAKYGKMGVGLVSQYRKTEVILNDDMKNTKKRGDTYA